jgi:hypothetical protein
MTLGVCIADFLVFAIMMVGFVGCFPAKVMFCLFSGLWNPQHKGTRR